MTASPLLRHTAAVADDLGIVAAHYGDPITEQRMLAAGRAVVDLSDRGVVTVTGPDRLSWLDSLTSQSLTQLAAGDSAETLLLDPNGRLEHAMHVLEDGTTTWLIVEGSAAPPLAAWLDRMRFMMRVEVADVSATWAVFGQLLPPGAEPLVEPATPNGQALLWRDPWVSVQRGGWQYAAEGEHPAPDFPYAEIVVERERLTEIARAVGAGEPAVAGALALEALRIAAWRPRFATEVDERSIPHEFDWLRSAVHLAKGCYRGQETVAKVHNLGHPPRRLVLLHLDGSDALLPGPGGAVLHGGAVVGAVTSSARHHELGPIALALVKRSLDPTAPLEVAVAEPPSPDAPALPPDAPASLSSTESPVTVAAAQQVIVPPEAGATAGVPRLPRLGAVRRPD